MNNVMCLDQLEGGKRSSITNLPITNSNWCKSIGEGLWTGNIQDFHVHQNLVTVILAPTHLLTERCYHGTRCILLVISACCNASMYTLQNS